MLVVWILFLLQLCHSIPAPNGNSTKQILEEQQLEDLKNTYLQYTTNSTDIKKKLKGGDFQLDPPKVSNIPEEVYEQLYRSANLTAVAYCVGYPLMRYAKIGNVFNCKLSFCKDNRDEYNIVQVFHPPLFDLSFARYSATGIVILSHKRQEIALVYRGTLSATDFITDMLLEMVPYQPVSNPALVKEDVKCKGNCKVHKGFRQAFKQSYKNSFPKVLELIHKYPNYKLFVTGHSLGGAIAQLAGLELKSLGYDPLVISLAGPKLGNGATANFTDELFDTRENAKKFEAHEMDYLSTGFWRVVANNDYVPLVPPGKDWHHAGLQFNLLKNFGLPQKRDEVSYSGAYKYNPILETVSARSIRFLDLLHIREHLNYFFMQDSCLLRFLYRWIPLAGVILRLFS